MHRLRTLLASTAAAAALLALSPVPLAASEDGCGYDRATFAINPSVIVNDQRILTDQKFGFARTIGQILSSQAAQDTAANRQAFLQTMLDSFSATSRINPDSGLAMAVDARPDEAGLNPAELLDAGHPSGLHPVGVFNRLDLAPADFSNCGEYRIVYTTRAGSPIDRFFLIFEARVANPALTGFEGCRPVADFWASLNGLSRASQAAELERFYFTGLGSGFGPVVDARNYGQPDGQVRGNAFVGFTKWQLREWVVGNFGPGGGTFLPTTVKTNPLAEFYADASAAGSLDPALEETERTAFLGDLANRHTIEILGVDGTFPNVGPGDPGALKLFKRDLFAGMATEVNRRFDEFQSDSQGDTNTGDEIDNPSFQAPAGGRALSGVGATLAANPLPHNRNVTADEALNRMGALTCGGCHQFSNDRPIGRINGQTITWPPSAFFVHIDEASAISPALRDWFLPARLANLKEAVCEPPAAKGTEPRPADGRAALDGVAGSDSRPDAVDAAAARVRELQVGDAARAAAEGEPEAVRDYRETVEDLRAGERAKPGAFVRIRRVH